MGSVTNLVLSRDEEAKRDGDSVLVPLRVPWYRSLPLSALEHLAITIDGRRFADDQLSLVVDGAERPFAQLRDASDQFWFVQDTAWARVPAAAPEATVALGVTADWRIPYLMMGPDRAVVRHITEDRVLAVAGDAR